MTCLKCGRETDQTFCERCRETMEKYPVKPGAIILLPKERIPPVKRNVPRRPAVSPEAQIQTQKKIIRRLSAVVVSLLVLMSAMGYAMFRYVKLNAARPVGQNYSTATKPASEAPVAEGETLNEPEDTTG